MAKGKILTRRTALRGAGGALVALPLLEAMTGSRLSAQPAETGGPMRFMTWFRPGGAVEEKWAVSGSESDFELSPTLAPLAPFKDRLMVFEGLDYTVHSIGVGHPHYKGLAAFLTGSYLPAGEYEGPASDPMGFAQNVSLDQVIARHIGTETRYRSLELAVAHDGPQGASPLRTTSYDGPDAPRTPMFDPREVYDRLFTDDVGTGEAAALARLKKASILDAVLEEYRATLPIVSGSDRVKLEEHFEQIREVEQALHREIEACQTGEPPQRTPYSSENFEQLGRMMIDLAVLAMSCDLTRVIGLQYSEPLSRNSFPFIDLRDYHHGYQHDTGYAPEELAIIELWYMEQFAYLVTRLAQTSDGEGSLLDNVVILNGTELSHAGDHTLSNIPVLLLGNLGGRIRSGRVLRYSRHPYNDLLVSVQNAFGIESQTFGAPGHSNGSLPGFV